jgi:integrase
MRYNSLLRGVRRLCKGAGVKVISPHEMRHSTSELWVDMGATEADIMKLLCQKDSRTTRRYMHRTDRRLAELAKNVGMVPKSSIPRETELPTNVIRVAFERN